MPHYRAEILTIFGSYFVRNNDFINSYWNLLTFNASSFYRSQNILGWSKLFVPDQKLIFYSVPLPNNLWHTKNNFHPVNLVFVPAQKFLTCTKHFGTCRRTRHYLYRWLNLRVYFQFSPISKENELNCCQSTFMMSNSNFVHFDEDLATFSLNTKYQETKPDRIGGKFVNVISWKWKIWVCIFDISGSLIIC